MAVPRIRFFAISTVAALSAAPAGADCTCRAGGQDYELGRSACLQTPSGARLATCDMVLNNTSWRISGTPCVSAEQRSGDGDASARAHKHPTDAGG